MITIGGLIKGAMRKIEVLAAGEPLSQDDGQDALEAFTLMLDAWSTENLLVPVNSTVKVNLLQGYSEYTIGQYPTDNKCNKAPITHTETALPIQILSKFVRDNAGNDYPIKIINASDFSHVSVKSSESRPTKFYLKQGWPLSTIKFTAIPYANEVLHLECLLPLSQLLNAECLTQEVNLPPGYQRALLYNLAVELAPEWGKNVSAIVASIAMGSKKAIKHNNSQPTRLRVDKALTNTSQGSYIINQGP